MSEWRDVPGYEGLYQVSKDGLVRGLPRLNARGHRVRGRMMKPFPISSGHLLVRLTKNAISKGPLVHRLVKMAFHGPSDDPEKTWVLHNDGNCKNNNLENLRWGTAKENFQDSVDHGMRPKGWRGHREITNGECARIHDLKRCGVPVSAISKWLGTGYGTVWNIAALP